jgi:hypothetical protein
MINRGPRFLRSYDSAPSPSPSSMSKLSFFQSLPVHRRSSLLTGEGGVGGWRGTKSSDHVKVWPSVNHSILCGRVPASHFRSIYWKLSIVCSIAIYLKNIKSSQMTLFWKKMLFIFERDLETKFDMLVKWSVAETSRSDLAKQTEDI